LAKSRLENAQRNGTRVKTVETQGIARLHTKSVEEMARDAVEARKNASITDKGKMTKTGV
jgi:alpha-galactosidase